MIPPHNSNQVYEGHVKNRGSHLPSVIHQISTTPIHTTLIDHIIIKRGRFQSLDRHPLVAKRDLYKVESLVIPERFDQLI